nr:MAG TPA: hypothetical protein [Bacteriophage sp.]
MDKYQNMSDEEFVASCEENLDRDKIYRCLNGFRYIDDDVTRRLLNIVKKYEKALDKACEELVHAYPNGVNKYDTTCWASSWKEWLMKDDT